MTPPVPAVVVCHEYVPVEVPGQPEVSPTRAELPPETEPKKQEPEEKASIQKKKLLQPEEKASIIAEVPKKQAKKKSAKGRFYSGKGRRHKEWQIDDILDTYLLTGELPDYVSDRQRLDYRKHRRLEERRKVLEREGQTNMVSGNGNGSSENILPFSRNRA